MMAEVVALDPQCHLGWFFYAYSLTTLGEIDTAIETYEKAVTWV